MVSSIKVRIELADAPIDLDVREIPVRLVARHPVGLDQAAKAGAVAGAGRQPGGVVDQVRRDVRVLGNQLFEQFDHLLITETAVAFLDDALGREEGRGVHDGRERAVRPDPHVRRIVHPASS